MREEDFVASRTTAPTFALDGFFTNSAPGLQLMWLRPVRGDQNVNKVVPLQELFDFLHGTGRCEVLPVSGMWSKIDS